MIFITIPKEEKYTAEDFLTMTDEGRCELIDGYIVDMSPAPGIIHQRIIRKMIIDISSFIDLHNEKCEPFITSNVKLTDDTVLIPDIYVTCHPENLDGQKHIGAPDWMIEIVSPSNFTNDYYTKLHIYKEHGVREYWIIDPRNDSVTVYIWDEGLNDCKHYTFTDRIPVYIFKDKTPPLEICVGNYL